MFEHQYDLPEGLSDRLAIAVRNILFTRKYLLSLLEDLEDDDWYWIPSIQGQAESSDELETEPYGTHIAWQVGHIAMSHYGLTLFRQRGRTEVDSKLMTGKFRKLFMKGTRPKPGREANPSPQEILDVLERVLQQALTEIPTFESGLDEAIDAPHAAFGTKYGALLFVASHEMLHAGQIGMLRRLMGKPPLR